MAQPLRVRQEHSPSQLDLLELSLLRAQARDYLAEQLRLLHDEVPTHLFKTDNEYKVIIKNRSGSEIKGEYFHGSILVFLIPGLLTRIQYHDLDIRCGDEAYIKPHADFWEMAPLEQIGWVYQVRSQTHILFPYADEDDGWLVEKAETVFDKYRAFDAVAKKTPAQAKSASLVQRVKRMIWLQSE